VGVAVKESTMRNVTDKQQRRDPWTCPDPGPADFEEVFSDPASYVIEEFPARSFEVVFTDDDGNPHKESPEELERERLARQALEQDQD
jgi:hypothetical protein